MNLKSEFGKQLSRIVDPINIKENEPMKAHTSFKVGGPVDFMIYPNSFEEIKDVVKLCKEYDMPYYILGNGSNLLVKDGGVRGVAIKLTKLNSITVNGDYITADCGATLYKVACMALENNLAGFEFASGIPGSVGGALAMNAGAYNGEMCQVVYKTLVLDDKGEYQELYLENLQLSYRSSIILKHNYVVLQVTYKLKQGDKEAIKNRIDDLARRRREKQPLEFPSAGSTFKRPDGYFAAKLIEDTGLKGTNVGDAEVSTKHSGFIINKGEASASDILNLIKLVQDQVKEKYNIDLCTEVRIIGED